MSEMNEAPNDFSLDDLVDLFERTSEYFRQRAAQAVNRELVIRNWMLGRYIVEFEQDGSDRAGYGTGLINELARKLKHRGFRGGSASTLKQIRAFYLLKREIGQTVSGLLDEGDQKSQTVSGFFAETAPNTEITAFWEGTAEELPLSWSHYVTLLAVDNPDECRFYEIEAAAIARTMQPTSPTPGSNHRFHHARGICATVSASTTYRSSSPHGPISLSSRARFQIPVRSATDSNVGLPVARSLREPRETTSEAPAAITTKTKSTMNHSIRVV